MKKILVLLSIMIIALAACAPREAISIVGEWGLVSYGDPANPTPAAPDVETSIIFGEDGQVNGTAGCNGFGGDYKVNWDTIQFDSLFMTEMACIGPADQQERVLFSVFVGTASIALDGDTLTITSADGSAVVVLEKK
ncbi:MAG: META domain-containing protein [Anaerolineales bacterium]|nr:MAG: META domain-containing protein [Anaerolineales bacterium]